jgi:uncharacterized membrane protein YdbT with pleckstrin-like domain
MGSFVNNSLLNGEVVEKEAEVTFISQLPLFIFGILFIWTIFIPVLAIIVAIIRVKTVELALTNKKVIGKAGFINRASIDLPISKLESITIDQGLFGRMFNYGLVSIRGVGGNRVTIPSIKDPLSFRRAVMDRMDKQIEQEQNK